jgi:hypothetical protein
MTKRGQKSGPKSGQKVVKKWSKSGQNVVILDTSNAGQKSVIWLKNRVNDGQKVVKRGQKVVKKGVIFDPFLIPLFYPFFHGFYRFSVLRFI